jgi:hypothetical protein
MGEGSKQSHGTGDNFSRRVLIFCLKIAVKIFTGLANYAQKYVDLMEWEICER